MERVECITIEVKKNKKFDVYCGGFSCGSFTDAPPKCKYSKVNKKGKTLLYDCPNMGPFKYIFSYE